MSLKCSESYTFLTVLFGIIMMTQSAANTLSHFTITSQQQRRKKPINIHPDVCVTDARSLHGVHSPLFFANGSVSFHIMSPFAQVTSLRGKGVRASGCHPPLRAASLALANVLNMDGVYFSLFNYWPWVLQGEDDVVCHLGGTFCLRWQHRRCLRALKIHSERLELSG